MKIVDKNELSIKFWLHKVIWDTGSQFALKSTIHF